MLVDEYQDTNTLQAEILYRLRPSGNGLTVVGDDAQSIYSFRAATVRNILDFPQHYPAATIITLEQNYRSTQPILAATNQVIGLGQGAVHQEPLVAARAKAQRPSLVTCEDEDDQAEYVDPPDPGIPRSRALPCGGRRCCSGASHHSMVLEAELARRNIPFHKYGGLKFVETAHVKDLLAFLRLAENPRTSLPARGSCRCCPASGRARRGS